MYMDSQNGSGIQRSAEAYLIWSYCQQVFGTNLRSSTGDSLSTCVVGRKSANYELKGHPYFLPATSREPVHFLLNHGFARADCVQLAVCMSGSEGVDLN